MFNNKQKIVLVTNLFRKDVLSLPAFPFLSAFATSHAADPMVDCAAVSPLLQWKTLARDTADSTSGLCCQIWRLSPGAKRLLLYSSLLLSHFFTYFVNTFSP
jgi:hypothetical protein